MTVPPLILLAPRVTEDSIRIWKAGVDLGWPLQRLPSWRAPLELCESERGIVIYAEPGATNSPTMRTANGPFSNDMAEEDWRWTSPRILRE